MGIMCAPRSAGQHYDDEINIRKKSKLTIPRGSINASYQ